MNNKDQPLIIIVDDDQAMRESLSDYFYRANFVVNTYSNGDEFLKDIQNHQPDVIICDLKMPNMDGMEVLKSLKNNKNNVPFIMMTAHGNIPKAVEAIQNDAYDFIEKPFSPKKLQKMANQAVDKYRKKSNKKDLLTLPLGKSDSIKEFHDELLEQSKSQENLLLIGEKGVNKLLIAKTIHHHSNQRKAPFVHINCSKMLDYNFKKIFVDIDNVFFSTNNGFLFLENLDEMPIENRTKLLTALKSKITNLSPKNNIFRIICSIKELPPKEKKGTNIGKICALIDKNTLYIPALREHKDDVFELFNSYIAQAANFYQTSVPLLPEQDVVTLSTFDWPGNQNQLKQIAELFVLLNRTVKTSISHLLKVSPKDVTNIDNKSNENLRTLMHNFECQFITQAMIECKGNITQVCDLLKIPRRTLNEKLIKHNIKRSSFLQD